LLALVTAPTRLPPSPTLFPYTTLFRSLLEDPQVLRHLRLGHGQALDQLAHGRLPLADRREELAAQRVGEGPEGGADLHLGHARIIFRFWNMSRGRAAAARAGTGRVPGGRAGGSRAGQPPRPVGVVTVGYSGRT